MYAQYLKEEFYNYSHKNVYFSVLRIYARDGQNHPTCNWCMIL